MHVNHVLRTLILFHFVTQYIFEKLYATLCSIIYILPTCRVYQSCHTANEYDLYSLILPVRKHRHKKQVNKHNTQPLILDVKSLFGCKVNDAAHPLTSKKRISKNNRSLSFKYRNLQPSYCKLRRYILTNNTRYRFTLQSICLQLALLSTFNNYYRVSQHSTSSVQSNMNG